MNYSEIIREVLDNTGQDRNSRNIITSIRHDIEKTVRDMFTDSEAPIKSESFTLAETESESIVSTVVPITLVTGGVESYTHTDDIYSMASLSITAKQIADHTPIVGDSVLNVTITSSDGTELLNEDITLSGDTDVVTDIDVAFSDIVGATMVLSGTSFNATANGITITDVTWTKTFSQLELPSYVYVPFGANFRVSRKDNGVAYFSKEMTEEEYNRWVPLGAIKEVDEDSEFFEIESNPATVVYSFENLEFDSRIGYFFSVVNDKLYLLFKPAVVGTVTIRFSYLPSLDVVEENEVPIHLAFINAIIDGTTVRQFQKLLLGVTDELGLIKIKSAMSMYNTPYKLAVVKFAGYNRKKTGVRSIKMFGILDDTAMLLQ